MKKNILILMAAGLFCLAACNDIQEIKEITQPEDSNAPVQMITETISARVGNGTTKATINGTSGAFSWTEGKDKIAVHTTGGYVLSTTASASGASTEFTVSYSGSRDYYAVYPHTLVYNESTSSFISECVAAYGSEYTKQIKVCLPSTYALSDIQDNNTICPMIATNTPESGWSFAQLCGLLRLTIKGIPTGTKSLKVDFNGMPVSGIFSVYGTTDPIPLYTYKHNSSLYTDYYRIWEGGSGDECYYEDNITITGITDQTSVTVNIPLPVSNGASHAYRELMIYACDVDGKPIKAVFQTLSSYQAARAEGKKVSATLSKEPFSVAYGKYALIAQSNLKATTTDSWSSWAFSFMDNPWDIVETDLGDGTCCTANYGGQSAVSLFSFATSGISHKHPNSTSSSSFDYYAYSNENFDLDRLGSGDQTRYADWGCNAISNDGINRKGCGWLTPSKDEWAYLLNTRSATYRYAKATIHSRNGLIIFPDTFNPTSIGVTITDANTPDAAFTSYSDDDWTKMANAGCVFLPVTGRRTSVGASDAPTLIDNDWKSSGVYWSRTINDSGSGKPNAYCIDFKASEINLEMRNMRKYGAAVRLILPVNY